MASKAATAAVVRVLSKVRAVVLTSLIYNDTGLYPHLFFPRSRKGYQSHSKIINPKLTPALSYLLMYSPETVAALQAFRKRHSEAQRISGHLNAQPTTVDLAHYRSVLKNKGIVDEVEKALREFKPVTYDVSTHVKAIETFETKAVRPPPPPSYSPVLFTLLLIADLLNPFSFVHQCARCARTPIRLPRRRRRKCRSMSN